MPSTIVTLLNEFHVSGKNSFRDQGWTFLSVWGDNPYSFWRDALCPYTTPILAPPLANDESNGLNTVATYVFWNLHEVEPGKWDFSGDKNLAEYIRIAGEEGMMVILRPGPYVCAEWEFGGYPWWLQNIPGMENKEG